MAKKTTLREIKAQVQSETTKRTGGTTPAGSAAAELQRYVDKQVSQSKRSK